MKKIFIILVVLLLLMIGVTIFIQSKKVENTPLNNNNGQTLFPVTATPVTVNYSGIINNKNTVIVGDGMYQLRGTENNPEAGFGLLYSQSDNSIYISIDKEPLSETRNAAGQHLLDLLNISKTDICSLKIYVGVAYDVDAELAGQNLGLGFCPGSIAL